MLTLPSQLAAQNRSCSLTAVSILSLLTVFFVITLCFPFGSPSHIGARALLLGARTLLGAFLLIPHPVLRPKQDSEFELRTRLLERRH